MTVEKTLVACLTPPGRGAIATIALAGPDAWRIVRESVSPDKPLPASPQPGRVWVRRLGSKTLGHDEVVVSAHSLRVELHCHGGSAVVDMLLDLLSGQGAEICTWQEFEARSAGDTVIAEARRLLPMALTPRTAGILLDQCQGAWTNAIALIKVDIAEGRRSEALKRIDELLRLAPLGEHLTKPWRVVIAGAPNVGKSSLVNALAGFERSVVSNIPGTTRDVVTTLLAIDGWPVEVSDTAGWRSSRDALEQAGVALATEATREADLSLWVLDATAPPVLPSQPGKAFQWVINKIDLPAAWDLARFPDAPRVSAKTKGGLVGLLATISRGLVPEPPPQGSAVPFCQYGVEMLQKLGSPGFVGER